MWYGRGLVMIKAEAIIFDKDGTLIDFDAFWVAVSREAIGRIAELYGMPAAFSEEALSAFGVHNGVADMDGVLCKGTYEQMGGIVYELLLKFGAAADRDRVTEELEEAYACSADAGVVKPTSPKLASVLSELSARGVMLAVVTTDNEEITERCLKALGVSEIFDRVYTDNGEFPVKPDPYCARDFLKFVGTTADKALMVGDTMTDMIFARNAGLRAVGIGNTEEKRARLMPYADFVISDMSELMTIVFGGDSL